MLHQPEANNLLEEKIRYSRFLLTMIAALSIMLLVNYCLAHDTEHLLNPRSMWFNRAYLMIVSIPVLILAWMDKQSHTNFGLRTDRWKVAVQEGIILTLILLPGIFLVRMLILSAEGLSLVIPANYFVAKPIDFAYTYCTSVVIQQCVRSFLQENLTAIFSASHPIMPIFVSSFLFGLMHLHFGLYAVVITFLVGVFFSLIYLRHQNIFGLVIPHTTLGIAAFMTGLL
jgi:membrane protease YdiL (CAAX protease family)